LFLTNLLKKEYIPEAKKIKQKGLKIIGSEARDNNNIILNNSLLSIKL
tara:strand:- start:19 stop:162 length:144 start_codon:yes stop_codon:yes gene_type:complete